MEEGPTGTIEATEATGPTGPPGTTEATGPMGPAGTFETTVPTEVTISLETLMASQDAAVSKEQADKQMLAPIISTDVTVHTPTLYQWARCGFPPIYPIVSVGVTPPSVCADGVSRPFFEYVEYLLGDTVASKMAALQTKLQGIQVSYSLESSAVTYHVSKA